ncbi:iron-sulfur cluster-binding protein [Helicobacter bizzozeronii CIII-1]|uniref:Iron-sulfur cluster-binding protein n=1 Tax=Helicobacter bizzozeronii (strain CIII-1) TaxID=1002804 RepID=F8KQB9_HELBC|nr:4Fe-4S binding protein [Helicobacter bizzozeronii]CCB80335.1 iron-sulfur cluster-binding protein [Helicobacter bizzozeronii CIII-1]
MLEFVYIKQPDRLDVPLHDHIEVLEDADLDVECVVANVPLQGAKRVAREINFLLENSTQDPLDLASSLSLLYEAHGLQFDFDTTKHTPTPEGLLSEFFSYDKEICQYHKRRIECCAKCSEVCPTEAITKLDPQIAQNKGLECEDNRHLIINHQACIDCGKCISVCPSGSLSYGGFSLECVQEVAKLYRGYVTSLARSQSRVTQHPA